MKPDVFAAVMATGIVSIAAADHGYDLISGVLAVIAVVALPALTLMAARRWREFDMRDPGVTMPLFTYVAACAVLAARFADHRIALWVFAGLALQGWVTLTPIAARSVWRHRWIGLRDNARGGWELASVATNGLAIVCADLGIVFWASILWVLGMTLYLAMTGLVLWRVGHNSSAPELVQPDVWILMGGAAIATLAGDHLHRALLPGPIADGVRLVTIVTWVVASVWIPILLAVTVRRFSGAGFPMVFPLGMYASATYAMSVETRWGWFSAVSSVFFWIAFAVWLIVAAGLLLRSTAPSSA